MSKEQRRIHSKTYRKANADKIRASNKAYRRANPDKVAAAQKAYRAANSAKVKVWRKAWRKAYFEANPEKRNAQNKAWQKANPKKEKARKKAWRDANPEKCREMDRKHRALKHKTQVEPVNEKIVFMRDGWICQICHKRVNKSLKHPHLMSPSLDHIIPLSQGGSHTYANVQLTHLRCNLSKQDNVLAYGEQLRIF